MRNLLRRTINGVLEKQNLKLVRASLPPKLHLYSVNQRPPRPLYLNVGAGNWTHPFWHNLENPVEGYDKSTAQGIDVFHDLTSGQPLPLEDDSLEAAYSSHVVEHLNDKFCRQLFGELHRCLKTGGYVRIVCPDANIYLDGYLRADQSIFRGIGEGSYWPDGISMEQFLLNGFASPLSNINGPTGMTPIPDDEISSTFAMHTMEEAMNHFSEQIPDDVVREHPRLHKTWFTVDKLRKMLLGAGFSDAWGSRYGQSKCLPMKDTDYFDQAHCDISLYVEAVKTSKVSQIIAES
jgi:predicted SAM-dependent methyltransferase